jgi:hypothetical protein
VAATWEQSKSASTLPSEEPPAVAFSQGFAVIDPDDEAKTLTCSDETLASLCSDNIPHDSLSVYGDRKTGFLRVLQFYRDVFTNSFRCPAWDIEEFDIPLKPDAIPVKSPGYWFFHAHLEALRLLLDKWVAEGVCSRSVSPWASPTFFFVQVFSGLIYCYRAFVPYCAEWSAPLSILLSKGVAFQWTELQQRAFEHLRNSLAEHCLRSHYDPAHELELYTDCSKYASGAVLSQRIPVGLPSPDQPEGVWEDRVLAYFSRTLSAAERNYSTHQQECLAIVSAIKYFHQFLAGRHFKLFTDHYSLATVMRWKEPPMRIARWIQLLSEYDFTAFYKAGSTLCNADA